MTYIPGTQKAEDSAHVSGDYGTPALAVRKDVAAALAGADGDYALLIVDALSRLHVALSGVELVDDAAFTPGTSRVLPVGAAYDDTAPDTVDEGDIGVPRMSARRELYAQLRDAAGNERGMNIGVIPSTWAVGGNSGPFVAAALYGVAGTNHEHWRSNEAGTVLASAARTATAASADLTCVNARGVRISIDITAIVDTPSIVVAIQRKDPVSGAYSTILQSVALVAVGHTDLVVYPGVEPVANEAASNILARTWRVLVTHADADEITYSVGYDLML